MLSIASAVVMGRAGDVGERVTRVRRLTIMPNPPSMADASSPKPIDRSRPLLDRANGVALTSTGTADFFFVGAATDTDCLTWLECTIVTGCSCSQSRGLGVGKGVGKGVGEGVGEGVSIGVGVGAGRGAGAIAWYRAIKFTTLLAQLEAPEVPTYGLLIA